MLLMHIGIGGDAFVMSLQLCKLLHRVVRVDGGKEYLYIEKV